MVGTESVTPGLPRMTFLYIIQIVIYTSSTLEQSIYFTPKNGGSAAIKFCVKLHVFFTMYLALLW